MTQKMMQVEKTEDLTEDLSIVEDGVTNAQADGLERQKNNGESANVTSETKTDKDVAFLTDIPSGSETALLCTKIHEDVWIADSGASSHMTNTPQRLYNQRKILSKIKIYSKEYVDSNIIGHVSGIAIQKDGTKKEITLRNVKFIPCLFCK